MTSKQQIGEWFDRGMEQNASHMFVMCDTFCYEDYPSYTKNDQETLERYKLYSDGNNNNMQTIMEVYDLRKNKTQQLNKQRVFEIPKS